MSALKIKTTTEKINQPKSCDFQYNEIFLDLFRFAKFQFYLSDNCFSILMYIKHYVLTLQKFWVRNGNSGKSSYNKSKTHALSFFTEITYCFIKSIFRLIFWPFQLTSCTSGLTNEEITASIPKTIEHKFRIRNHQLPSLIAFPAP